MVKTVAFLLPSTSSAQPRLSAPMAETEQRQRDRQKAPRVNSVTFPADPYGTPEDPPLEQETFPQILTYSTDTGRH